VSPVLRTLAFAALYTVATAAGRLTVLDSTNLSLVWPAAGVAAIWFLVQHGSRWRLLDAAALSVVTVVINVATGAPLRLTAFFVVANLVQAELFVRLYRRWLPHLWGGGGDRPLARLTDLWRIVAAALLSTTCGALIGPTGVWVVEGAYSWSATAVWMTRNTVSILLVGVAGVRLGRFLALRRHGGFWTRVRTGLRAEYLVVVGLSSATYGTIFGFHHHLPLAFMLLVMTVWAGIRLRTGFVIAHDTVFGTVAVLFTLHGTGPFAAIPDNAARALVAQLFVGMIAVVGLALALGRDERDELIGVLRGAQEAATGQARLMSTIVDSMNEGLTVVDEQGRVLLRNPAVRDLLGGVVSGADEAGPGFAGLCHLDGTPVDPAEMPHRRAISGEDVRDLDVLVRNPGVPDGRILRISSTALPGERDGHRYAVTVFHDVTAERRHRDELAAFAGVVAHDLLNPLTTVEGWAEAVAELVEDAPPTPLTTEAAGGLKRIRRAAAHMRNLINDLLAYTTVRDGSIAAVSVPLGPVLEDIATARIDQAQSNGKPVPVFDLRSDVVVHADPVLLRQLLDNLISNSIKYTEPGVVPRIGVVCEQADDRVVVHVTDNGIGIPSGQHETIFDNFHRAHRSAGYAGTGLGLGICKRIVERHGGTIVAADNPSGTGSRFSFTLPAEGGTIPDAAPEPVQRAAVARPAVAPAITVDTTGPVAPRPAPVPAAPRPAVPAERFDHAAHLVLDYLHQQMPLAFWAVTRVENGRQTYLYLDADNGYGLRQGGSHPWEDSFCVHMAAGRAPTVALDAQSVPEYARAGVNDLIRIGTYAGAVISETDGSLFGAICGLDPEARSGDPRMAAAESQLALLGQLLTTVLAADRAAEKARHALLVERLAVAETDRLTGLPNSRAWDRLLDEARERYDRLADPTTVLWLDVQSPSIVDKSRPADAYRLAAATAARRALRDGDILARVEDDRFGILLHCAGPDAKRIATRLRIELETAGVVGTLESHDWQLVPEMSR
jgi:signal transduction histidine kinase/GGDEF domain-containing protein/integral membrane sensor domain MASE1